MEPKFNKDKSSMFNDDDLTFTKEDRIKTFNKIHENHKKQKKNNTSFHFGKRYVGPILGSVMVIVLAIGLLLPNLFSENEMSQENSNRVQASQQDTKSFSALLMGKSSTDDSSRRSEISILLTYNGRDNSMKLVLIPRDTYVEILNSEGKMIGEDKVMHASALETRPEPALKTVSNLFNDIPIDYYAIIPEEAIYRELGITINNAEEDHVIFSSYGDLMKERLSYSKIKNILEESETNIPSDIFQEEDSNSGAMQVINMEEGLENTFINGIYYVKINQRVLENISNTLKKHLGDK